VPADSPPPSYDDLLALNAELALRLEQALALAGYPRRLGY